MTLVDLYAERNGRLHVLCRELVAEVERIGGDMTLLRRITMELDAVPQLDPRFDDATAATR
jgi:hypothetical protein